VYDAAMNPFVVRFSLRAPALIGVKLLFMAKEGKEMFNEFRV
jgi:hypothetical protein